MEGGGASGGVEGGGGTMKKGKRSGGSDGITRLHHQRMLAKERACAA